MEKFAIHDYEGFEWASISEYQGVKSGAEIADFIAEYGSLGAKLIEYFTGLDKARKARRACASIIPRLIKKREKEWGFFIVHVFDKSENH